MPPHNNNSDYSHLKSRKFNWNGLRNALRLYSYIKPYTLAYITGLLLLFVTSLANLAMPKLLGDLVNTGTTGGTSDDLNRIIFILSGILIVQAVFSYFRITLFTRVTEKSMADLRTDTYQHLLRLPLKFFDKHRVGEINSRISADISLVHETLTSTLADFFRQLIIVIGAITYLLIESPKLTVFMLSIVPISILLVFFFGRYIRKLSREAQKGVAESNTVVEETLQGIRSVKAYTNEKHELNRYETLIGKVVSAGIRNGRFRGAFSTFLTFGIFGSMIAVVWKGSSMLSAGEILAGDLVEFLFYTVFIAGNIGGMAAVITRIQRFVGATEDLFEFYEEDEEITQKSSSSKQANIELKGRIRFENLSFAYPNRPEKRVIQNLNLSIEDRQLIALVGPSGAGKSTLTTLLLRLYDPTEGIIYFDERPHHELDIESVRKQIALVPQDIFLFGGSIRENIAYGKPDATDAEIYEAARQANCLEFIESFPEGLNTIVGERGTQLSGGQRQRVAIARAILKNPRILILDEATSSLDSESERLVQEALEKLMHGRTSIVIAHRLSTVRQADNIIVLDQGKITESGAHDELINLPKGLYKHLSELQFAEYSSNKS